MSIYSITTYAFENCSNLACVAIANENAQVSGASFRNTPIGSTYRDYIGTDKYCEDDSYYNKCDGETFIYYINANNDVCTTAEVTQYYYVND